MKYLQESHSEIEIKVDAPLRYFHFHDRFTLTKSRDRNMVLDNLSPISFGYNAVFAQLTKIGITFIRCKHLVILDN